MKIQAIIPTAGLGTRLSSEIPKPLIEINGKPIFVHTINAVLSSERIDSIILVVHEDYISDYRKIVLSYKLDKVKHVVVGGDRRCDSVRNGLNCIDEDTDIVLIHDGARPLIDIDIINSSIDICNIEAAAIVGVPIKPTVKEIDPENLEVVKTLMRKNIWEIQTPQVFNKSLLVDAYKKAEDIDFTDDASLVESLGFKVKVVKGSYKNIKITTAEDLILAEYYLEKGVK